MHLSQTEKNVAKIGAKILVLVVYMYFVRYITNILILGFLFLPLIKYHSVTVENISYFSKLDNLVMITRAIHNAM